MSKFASPVEEPFEYEPEPCECGKGEWRQIGYDPNYCGYELIELECTNCGKLITVEGKSRWRAGRI